MWAARSRNSQALSGKEVPGGHFSEAQSAEGLAQHSWQQGGKGGLGIPRRHCDDLYSTDEVIQTQRPTAQKLSAGPPESGTATSKLVTI